MASTAIVPGAGAKRPIEAVSGHAKKLRSKIPRRKRLPLLFLPIAATNSEAETESSSSCLRSELTADSGVGFAGSDDSRKPRAANKPSSISYSEFPGDEFRRVTRAYSRRKQEQRWGEKAKIELGATRSEPEMAISEASGVSGVFPAGNLKEIGELAPAISESSCVDSVSVATASKTPNPTAEDEISGVARAELYDLDLYSDFACSERLSDDDDGGGGDGTGSSEYYSTCNETTQSEFGSDLFRRFSPLDSSDYSLTDLVESPDDFSERSREGSAPSATFSLFLQLSQQFTSLSAGEKSRAESKPGIKPEFSDEFTLMTFEKDDEESYRRFRIRERNEVLLQNIAEDYRTATNCGDLILRQRLRMVNWMLEYSAAVELHQETLFLGVSLMDRFLGRGYFVTERNLQLLGIASVTLATRIGENQPCNCVRQKSFVVGSSVYSRCEVVAMEWLLLEALNFRCFLPTIHNFLWFYLKAARADAEVEELSRYLASLSLLDHGRLNFWPSTVAAGLVILACLATNRDSSCDSVLETHVRSKNDDLPECIQSLEWLVKYAC